MTRRRVALRHHQYVEHDDRRQRQDHRPDADAPQNVLGAETLFPSHGVLVFEMHDAAPRCCCYGNHRYAVSFKNPVSISLAFDRTCYHRLTTAGSWLMA